MSNHTFRIVRPGWSLIVVAGVVLIAMDILTGILFLQGAENEDKLLKDARDAFQPLPKDASTAEFPVTPERVALGRQLFFDPRISVDGTGSCMRCHQPALYGADGLAKSRGVQDKLLPRNAPTVLNAGLHFKIHWDGVFANVEEQARKALLGPAFGNPDFASAMNKIKGIAGYPELFHKAFPDDADPVNEGNWGKAIGAYERTLITPSRFDEFLNGKSNALSAAETRGLRTFLDTGCADCHNGALIGGMSFEKFGVNGDYWNETNSQEIDEGRFKVTKAVDDKYVFKVPSLRNVAMSPPYFHDGSVSSLSKSVRIMAKLQLDKALADTETNDIVKFLESLTGTLPENFANAPILPAGAFNSTESSSISHSDAHRAPAK